MNRARRIEEKLESSNCEVNYIRLCEKYDGMYVPDINDTPQVIVAPDGSSAKVLSILAHEAGHHFTGLSGDAGRDEEKANRWAASELVDLHKIIQATIDGCQSYYELCEALDLDEDFVKTSIKSYRNRYGDSVEIDHYYLNLYPIWVKDMETGRIWPEE